ncbi:hypothetical protein [Streptomyces sp. H27-D2]|uniref:hypothetical protein n=1 Tax=Streptomyces sp. H27-D2 TaxID=3046304 RepID=UPI002DB962E3|nr:hypothetical protein [Streptomyces sp. H27-D2]MEC4015075.1 hypothetical protein [Streptomyces sp. H27-D2]
MTHKTATGEAATATAASEVTHVSILRADLAYDHRAEQAALAVRLHLRSGGTQDTVLVMEPGQMEIYSMQLARAIDRREKSRSGLI